MLAVLPAGGVASRFGGIYKELLPIGNDMYLLDSAIRRAGGMGATRFLVISNEEKASTHARFLDRHCSQLQVDLIVRHDHDSQLWDALRGVLPYCQDRNLLILPDTVFSPDQAIPDNCHIAFGCFWTRESERFSVLKDGTILTKSIALKGSTQLAWGCVYWSRVVTEHWQENEANGKHYSEYDNAFEHAALWYGWTKFAIGDYHDLGTWEAYQEFVRKA